MCMTSLDTVWQFRHIEELVQKYNNSDPSSIEIPVIVYSDDFDLSLPGYEGMTAAAHREKINELLEYNNGRYQLRVVEFNRTSYREFLERETLFYRT